MSDDIEQRLEAAADAAIRFKSEYRKLLKSGMDEQILKERLDAAEDVVKARQAARDQARNTAKVVRRF